MNHTIELDKLESLRIGRFQIVKRLGAGAMGVVYLARDTLLQRDVALKLILPELTESPRLRARFLRECQVAAALNHPGIAIIYEAGESEKGWLYLASELVVGETLSARIARGPIPATEVIELSTQLCDALAAAHAKGVVHRDIKPGNIMVTADNQIKVLDFGLARLLGRDVSSGDDEQETLLTQEGTVLGTPAYMSPEQAAGEKVDNRTDIFALGCVIYEMLSGNSPFRSGSVAETLRRILCEEAPSLRSSGAHFPPDLEKIIRRALAKQREDRYPEIQEMSHELRQIRVTTATRWSSRWRAAGKWAVRVILGLVLVVLAGGLLRARFQKSPALAFHSRDYLLITAVDNQTEDEAFDFALRTAFEADLQQSPYARVFEQSQVAEILRLMRRDPASRVDEQLGRDICRFAGVRAMLMLRIFAVGKAYELQAILVEPASGRSIDRFRVVAQGREEVLLHGIDKLTRQVRSRLGESLESIEKTDRPVERVTTSSWMALQYLALSNEKWGQGEFQDAATLLEMAIEKDHQFATAKGTLGLLLIQFLDQPERGKQLLREALEAGDGLPEHEYLMIKAANRQFVDGDLEGALQEYELISDLYPDDYVSYNNRGRIEMALGHIEKANHLYTTAAELGPYSSIPLINIFFLNIDGLADAHAAEAAARRLLELSADTTGFRSMLGWSLAAQGRLSEAEAELRRVCEVEPDHQYALPNLALVLFASGKGEEAVALYRRLYGLVEAGKLLDPDDVTLVDFVVVLAATGNRDEASRLSDERTQQILSSSNAANPPLADELLIICLEAAVGRAAEVRDRIAALQPLQLTDAQQSLRLAQAYALVGEHDQALRQLSQYLEDNGVDPFLPLVRPAFHPLLSNPEFLELFAVERLR